MTGAEQEPPQGRPVAIKHRLVLPDALGTTIKSTNPATRDARLHGAGRLRPSGQVP